MSDYPAENELPLALVIPHTTAVRRNRWEFPCTKSFLKPGVFHLQQIQPISLSRFEAKLGALTSDEFRSLREQLAALLKLDVQKSPRRSHKFHRGLPGFRRIKGFDIRPPMSSNGRITCQ